MQPNKPTQRRPPRTKFIGGPLDGLLKDYQEATVVLYINEFQNVTYERDSNGNYVFVNIVDKKGEPINVKPVLAGASTDNAATDQPTDTPNNLRIG